MKGYIYTMYRGADPGRGWKMTDPIFGKVPTLGACMTNIRRAVVPGDYIFAISGRTKGVAQYIVGGFEVREKIDALVAFHRFPQNRMQNSEDGTPTGNIIVDSEGRHSPLDSHSNFERRIENYIVGRIPLYLERSKEIDRARENTLSFLADEFGQSGDNIGQIIGRWRRLNSNQVANIIEFLQSMKE
jgi:hypothetical protein